MWVVVENHLIDGRIIHNVVHGLFRDTIEATAAKLSLMRERFEHLLDIKEDAYMGANRVVIHYSNECWVYLIATVRKYQ